MSETAPAAGHIGQPVQGSMQARIVRVPGEFLEVKLYGHVGLDELLELIRKLGVYTKQHGDKRVMFNLLLLEGEMHVGGQMQIGQQVAQCFSHLSQVASVVPTAKMTRASESIARSRGVRLKIFDSRDDAVDWLRNGSTIPAELVPGENGLDPARCAIWDAVKHLFPSHAQAIQLPTGTLAISWAIRSEDAQNYEMATPITVRLEEDLVERLRMASGDQRKRIAANHEQSFREGLIGYDPYTLVPRARVIILG